MIQNNALLIKYFFLCLFLGTGVSADEVPIADQLISEMSRANRELNYAGVIIYSHDGQMDTMQIIHKMDENGESERLFSLTGIPREVIWDKNSVTCILSDNQALMVERRRARSFAFQLPDPIDTVAEYYAFSVVDEDRIVDRPAWIVEVKPKDEYRYGYRLWIDKEHKILLKSQLQNMNGHSLEQFLFAQLQIFDDIPEEWLEPSMSGTFYIWQNDMEGELPSYAEVATWFAGWVPSGFTMNDYGKQIADPGQMPVDHLIYGDGLALVSVFVERLNISKTADNNIDNAGSSSMGGINAFTTENSGYQVTVVGAVPLKTAELMAKSVTMKE